MTDSVFTIKYKMFIILFVIETIVAIFMGCFGGYFIKKSHDNWNYTNFHGLVYDYTITQNNDIYYLNLNMTKTQKEKQKRHLKYANTLNISNVTDIFNITSNNNVSNNDNDGKCVYSNFEHSYDHDALVDHGDNLISDYFDLSKKKGTNECVDHISFKLGINAVICKILMICIVVVIYPLTAFLWCKCEDEKCCKSCKDNSLINDL